MLKRKLSLFVVGFFLLLPILAEGQAQGGGGSTRTATGGGDVGGAFSAMDSAIAEEEDLNAMDEYYLGRAVAANILSVYRPYTRSPELTAYLNRICQTIAVNSPQPEIFNGYHVIIMDSSEYNAFATPGGHILVTRGLVEAAASEDMLAAVIAHELAHILLKHGVSIVADMRLNDALTSTADRAGQLAARESQSAARAALFRNSVTKMVDVMVKNGYSQAQEFEADNAAMTLLAASGYNPGALLEVLRILQRTQSSQRGGFASTHPSPAARISNAEGRVSRYRIQDTSSHRVSRFRNK